MTATVILSKPETVEDYALEVRLVGDCAQVWIDGKYDTDGSATDLRKIYGFSAAETDLIASALSAARSAASPRPNRATKLNNDIGGPIAHEFTRPDGTRGTWMEY